MGTQQDNSDLVDDPSYSKSDNSDLVDDPSYQKTAPNQGILQRGMDYLGGLGRTGMSMSLAGQLLGLMGKNKPQQGQTGNVAGGVNPYQPGDLKEALLGNAPHGKDYLNRMNWLDDVKKHYLGNDTSGNPIQMTDRDMAGTVGDIGSQMGGNAMGRVALEAAQPMFNSLANKATLMHLRGNPKLLESLGPEGQTAVAEQTRASGAMPFGAKASTTAANLKDIRKSAYDQIQGLLDESDALADPQAVVSRIKKEVIEPLRDTVEGDEIADKIEPNLDKFVEKYKDQPVPVQQLEKENRLAYKKLGKAYQNPENPALVEAKQGVNSTRKDIINEMVNNPNFEAAKEQYGNLSDAYKMARRTGNIQGLMSHITDMPFYADALRHTWNGVSSGDPKEFAKGLGEVALRKMTKGRMASSLSNSLDSISYDPVQTAIRTAPFSVWGKMLQNEKSKQ